MAQLTRTRLTLALLLAAAPAAHAQADPQPFAAYVAHELAQNSFLALNSGGPSLPPTDFVTLPAPSAAELAFSNGVSSSDPSLVILPAGPADADTNLPSPRKPDINERYYYRNRFELSLETGALFINTPFVFDVFVGGDYSHNPLHYTTIPIFPAIRWQVGPIKGWGPLRGNTELTASVSLTLIARGPETAYGAFDLGFRRNFIPRNWIVTPYFEGWLGAGYINAAEPHGNPYAQGQDFTFTIRMGTGLRYNINERFAASLAASYMHVSNLYLSEPQYEDNGINVVGPVITVYMRVGKPKK